MNFWDMFDDLSHYCSSPGFSWDALVKKTEATLDLLTDYDQHLFVEKGMRGGISILLKRYCKANNKYLNDYGSYRSDSYIIYYLDSNDLKGLDMSQPPPASDLK